MAHNKVKLSQVIRDFIVTLDGDDYASNASDYAIRNFALRGIREIGFDLGNLPVCANITQYLSSINPFGANSSIQIRTSDY